MLLQMALLHSFLCLSSSPLYYMFLIHSLINEYLGYFHALAFEDSVAINRGIHVSFQIEGWIYAQE